MKKKFLIVLIVFLVLFVSLILGLFTYYKISLTAPEFSKEEQGEKVTIIVEQGMISKNIIDMLYSNGLIRNKYIGYAYLKLNNGFVLQAGVYEIEKGLDLPDILEYIGNGNVVDDSISVTFIEGERITTYVKVINQKFGYSETEIMETISDEKYLQGLIDKYWFLTEEILNDKLYYALEGYLFPSTYKFEKDASVEEIIGKMLDTMGIALNEYKSEISESNYTVHELLTLSSIIQNEGKNVDFKNISSVSHNRLNTGMRLESCATSFYGVRKDFTSIGIANSAMISNNNPYNTYVISKLPIGPISSPSKLALEAAIIPNDTKYYFFLSDNEGKTYFQQTYAEHQNKQRELDNLGKWDR